MKAKLAVLYGGIGVEREVSLVSGGEILRALRSCYDGVVEGIELNGPEIPEDLDSTKTLVLLALHGEFGEDGRIQRLLDAGNVEYCGSGAQSSHLCMDKNATKLSLTASGVTVVPGVTMQGGCVFPDLETLQRLGDRLIAKPIASGSSVGLYCLDSQQALEEFIERSEEHPCEQWLIEQRIFGREFSVGVLDGTALEPVEIVVPEGRIYDYEQKYQRGDTHYVCPASLSGESRAEVKGLAEAAFKACGCRDYARVDFMYCVERSKWFVLELNTLPGMTPQSLFPKSALGQGLSFEQLLLKMIGPGQQRLLSRNLN